jgi:molybdate transport system permease protein
VSRRRPAGARAVGIRPPALVVTLAVVGVLVFFVAPLAGLVQRAPWASFWSILTDSDARTALRLSLECSLAATGLALVFGLPIAWVLARTEFRGKAIARAFAILPMVLPPVVGGVALSKAFGRRGLVGQYLDQWFGIRLPFTTASVILAETFVAMPFLIITVEAALRSLDTRYEAAGATLGASRWTVLRRITLPAIAPSLAAGAALTWARALGEFGATITFAGNFKGVTQTMPLAVYLAFETDPGSAIVLSLVLLAVSITVLALVGRRVFGARPIGVAAT